MSRKVLRKSSKQCIEVDSQKNPIGQFLLDINSKRRRVSQCQWEWFQNFQTHAHSWYIHKDVQKFCYRDFNQSASSLQTYSQRVGLVHFGKTRPNP